MSAERQLTYATKLTGNLASAVGVVAVSGPAASEAVLKCWKSASGKTELVLNRVYYGQWIGPPEQLHENTEDVVLCRVGTDTIEIHCHGGSAVLDRILKDLASSSKVTLGPRPSADEQDQVTKDAWRELQQAKTINAVHLLLTQANGKLAAAIQDLINDRSASVEQKQSACETLIARGRVGLLISQAPEVVILGPPNAGKSTLINRLLGWERAIVDPTPGTTRDVLREEISLEGWPLVILDTAGLRNSTDSIEMEGISKAIHLADKANCILLLVDGEIGWTQRHQEVFDQYGDKVIAVLTKLDLFDVRREQKTDGSPDDAIAISALTGQGIESLVNSLIAKLGYDASVLNEAVPFRREQLETIQAAKELAHDQAAFAEILTGLLRGKRC